MNFQQDKYKENIIQSLHSKTAESKEKVLTQQEEKSYMNFKGATIRLTADFPRKIWDEIFKALKDSYLPVCNPITEKGALK